MRFSVVVQNLSLMVFFKTEYVSFQLQRSTHIGATQKKKVKKNPRPKSASNNLRTYGFSGIKVWSTLTKKKDK